MKKTFFKTFFISLMAFSLVWGVYIYKTVFNIPEEEVIYKENFIDRMVDGKDDITFLLLGIDAKDVMESKGTRTDTMMLCKADKSTGEISILSIPRDTKAYIRGRKNEEIITHAHAYGGPELSMKTVKDLLGVDVEYYVKVDYNIVKEFVTLVDGVAVDVPMDMEYSDPTADPPLYINLSKGYQTLDGDQALQFLRFRKGNKGKPDLPDGDLGRIRSQQQFIEAAMEKILRPSNIGKIPQMAKSFYNNVDTNIPMDVVAKFAMKAKNFGTDKVEMATLPGEALRLERWYFIMDEEESEILVKTMFSDQRAVKNTDIIQDEETN
ncbi:MAG: LCP family protein [Tissierellia bacterium]|nr:LCP family protein [Tissierellia bacterium]